MDRVQVLKQEWASLGGSIDDEEVTPSPIEPQEDAIEAAGVYLQDVAHRDELVYMFRTGDNLMFTDVVNAPVSLSALMAGGFDPNRQVLDVTGRLVYVGDGDIVLKG